MPISAALIVAAELITLPAVLAKAARRETVAAVVQAAQSSISGGASH